MKIAGSEAFRLDELIRQRLTALNDPREVIADPRARYFGAELSARSIVPGGKAELGEMRFEDWLSLSANEAPTADAKTTPQRA